MDFVRRGAIWGALFASAIFVAVPTGALLVYFFYHHQLPLAPSDFIAASLDSAVPSLISIVLSLIFGLFSGYYLATRNNKVSKLGTLLFRIPLGVPPLIAGIMLLISLGPNSPIGKVFHGRLTDSLVGVTIAQLFAALPFTVEGFRGAFSLLGREAQVVADSLEMGEVTRLLVVFTPLIWPSLRSTLVTSYLRAFGEFGAVLIVAYSPASLPIYTYVSFEGSGLPATVIPVVATLIISGVFAFAISKVSWPKSIKFWRLFGLLRHRDLDQKTVGGTVSVSIDGVIGEFSVGIALSIDEGATAIVGPSGSGKTLTLHSMAHHPISGLSVSFSPEETSFAQRIGYVPQREGLWRHLTLRENIDLVAAVVGSSDATDQLIDLFGVGQFADLPISALSGGQYQRGAIVRAFASNSDVLILDEPLSQIDIARRRDVIDFIREYVTPRVKYLILVTHDIDEAIQLADSINIINNGRVEGRSNSGDILRSTMTRATARALGFVNFISLSGSSYAFLESDASVVAGGAVLDGDSRECVILNDLTVARIVTTTRGRLVTLSSKTGTLEFASTYVLIPYSIALGIELGDVVSVSIPRDRLAALVE
ncbi:MAG: ATP-binding cassette domain-containing protein [Actinomycetota bacterium]|nr:ATP-binding cassette domain-containing protein [Actinomycetota bacterium]